MSSFSERIASGILLLDGSMGRELMRRGVVRDEPPESVLLTKPDAVRAVHQGHVEAGAEAIYTNTLGASRVRLGKAGLGERTAEVNRTAVEIARSAKPGFVLGSVGPTGELLEPYGDMDPDEALATFKEQAETLVKAKVDGIVVETFSDLKEALLAVKAARDAGAAAVLATMTFEGERQQYRTVMGTTPEQAVEALREAGADAVGANCGGDTPGMVKVIERMRAADPEAKLVAKPNAGAPMTVDGKTVYPMGPEEFAEIGAKLRDAGASLVGGCCGTTAGHIAALVRKLKAG